MARSSRHVLGACCLAALLAMAVRGHAAERTNGVTGTGTTITILEPQDGAVVMSDRIIVRGTVASQTGEVGVYVSTEKRGRRGFVSGNRWAGEASLHQGKNAIDIVALDGMGGQARVRISVTVPLSRFASLELLAVPFSGVPPLKVRWSFSGGAPRPLVRFEFDETGGGTFGRPMAKFEDVEVTYTTAGLLFPVLRATDDQGNQYTTTTPLNVLPRDQTDALIRARWDGMKAALMRGDIEAALAFFTPAAQDGYRKAFTALGASVPQVARDMRDIQLISVREDEAQYRLRRSETVQGQPTEITYYVYFVLGGDGVWRIRQF